jgi:EmrB/QacA subfamily drug resistance transporter
LSAQRRNPSVTFAVLATGGISYALMQSLVVPALADIQHAFGVSEAAVSWVLTAYLVSASVATPIIGRLGDMYGKTRLLVLVLVLLCVGTVVAALATSLGVMLVGRVIQGAAGGIFPLAFGIIRDEFPRERVAGSIGLMSALLGVGAGVGFVLTGPIADNLSYHWLFWLPLVPIVATTILTIFLVPESPIRVPGQVNWLAAALLSGGLVLVLVGVSQASSWDWLSAKTFGCIAAGVVVLASWVWVETRSRDPLVDMKMMRIKGVWTTNVVALLLGFGMYATFFLLPQFVETDGDGFGFNASITKAGLFMLPSTTAMLVAGSQTGRLEKRFGSKPPLLAGCGLACLSFLILAFAHDQQWQAYLASLLLGAGVGLAFAAMINLIIENVGPAETGVATGVNTVTRTIGGSFGGAVTASILAGTVVAGGDLPTEHGYTVAFALCAAVLVVGLLVGLMIPQRRPEAAFVAHAVGDLD